MMTWESILLVKNVQPADYGGYECMAHNSLGDETHQVRLEVKSVPEPPNGLKVVNSTHDSVTLSWIPGFDGGYEQTYKVKWAKVGVGSYRTEEVFPKNATAYTIGGLALATEYEFRVAGKNLMGEGNYTTDIVRQETSSRFSPRFIHFLPHVGESWATPCLISLASLAGFSLIINFPAAFL